MPNRSNYGQSPELFAKMTYAFPGGNPNTQQWEFIPTKAAGDNSTRWIGDPGYRWDELYATDIAALRGEFRYQRSFANTGTLSVIYLSMFGMGAALLGRFEQALEQEKLVVNGRDDLLVDEPAGIEGEIAEQEDGKQCKNHEVQQREPKCRGS